MITFTAAENFGTFVRGDYRMFTIPLSLPCTLVSASGLPDGISATVSSSGNLFVAGTASGPAGIYVARINVMPFSVFAAGKTSTLFFAFAVSEKWGDNGGIVFQDVEFFLYDSSVAFTEALAEDGALATWTVGDEFVIRLKAVAAKVPEPGYLDAPAPCHEIALIFYDDGGEEITRFAAETIPQGSSHYLPVALDEATFLGGGLVDARFELINFGGGEPKLTRSAGFKIKLREQNDA